MAQNNWSRKTILYGLIISGIVTLTASYFIINYKIQEEAQNAETIFPYPDPEDKRLVGLGQQLYAHECASCHGANLEGEQNWRSPRADGSLPAPPHDQSGHTWHHPDGVLLSIAKYGGASAAPEGFVSRMPAFEGILSNEEISATLAFIKSKWPKDIRMRQQLITQKADKK